MASGTVSSGFESDTTTLVRPPIKPIRKTQPLFTPAGQVRTPSFGAETLVGSSFKIGSSGGKLQLQTSSAMKSIMDQGTRDDVNTTRLMLKQVSGGLVELKPTRIENGKRSIPTRTIGDPSTGTDANANANLNSPPSPDIPGPSNTQPASELTGGRPSRTRPTFVPIPPPPSPTQVVNNMMNASSNVHLSPSFNSDSPLRVLVVDDDQMTRKLMKRMLNRLGCEVSTAENGQIAFELITGDGRTPSSEGCGPPGMQLSPIRERLDRGAPRYELVFLDNQMPVLSGLELVAKLRDMGRSDFIVGVTGNALLSDQEEYQEAGVD